MRKPMTSRLIILGAMIILGTLQATHAQTSAGQLTDLDVSSAAAEASQQLSEIERIESALLAPPDQCASPCFWDFQPGKNTLAQFKLLALAIFTDTGKAYTASDYVLHGLYNHGVAFHTSAAPGAALDSIVDYVYVRVDPMLAQTASVKIEPFTPASIIPKFGNPDDAFLLFGKGQLRGYRLVLLYASRNVVYIIRSSFQDGKACLTLDGVQNLTLYRFADSAAATQFVAATAGSDGLLQTIKTTTKQTATDFVQMAQAPDTRCLVVTP
jgi:hypothetical protein